MKAGIAAVLFLLLLSVSVSEAHPPREIRLNCDGGKLEVQVLHGVDEGSKHFIEKIDVRVGAKVVAEKNYTSQPNPEGLSETFSLAGIPSGSVLTVRAQCNIFGSLEATCKVP